MTKDEALKLALEALETVRHKIDIYQVNVCDDVDEAITAIREALAEQSAKEKAPQSANCEAPGWINSDHARRDDCITEQPYPDNFIDALMYDVAKRDSEAQQQEQVPRSKAYDKIDRFLQNNLNSDDDYAEYSTALDSLYTSPPASKPLTDEEIENLWQNTAPYYDHQDFARDIEAAHGIKE